MDKKVSAQFSTCLNIFLKEVRDLHFEKIHKRAIKWIKDEQEAHDIVKNTFLALEVNLSKTLNSSRIGNLLLSNTRENCKDLIKKSEKTGKNNNSKDKYSASGEKKDWFEIVQDAVERLPPKRKTIIKYIYWEELSSNEVAEKMGLSRQTVLNQKSRALRWLEQEIRKEASKYYKLMLF